jgi:hypothetical protein
MSDADSSVARGTDLDDVSVPAVPPKKRMLGTLGFVVVLTLVLGVFVWLSNQEGPPRMPASDVHVLKFTNTGELVGLAGEPNLDDMLSGQVKVDKELQKQNVIRVNNQCMACHSAASVPTPPDHLCRTQVRSNGAVGICMPEVKHPPKDDCIKCHRMPRQ